MYTYWGIGKFFRDSLGSSVLFAGADIIFRVPLLRRVMTLWACTRVSAQAMKHTLQIPFPHNILLHSVDGIAGMFYGIHQEQVVIERRQGFCRIALETGASLVPCYMFGANELYHRKFGPDSLAAKISRACHISFVYWTGRFGVPFGFLPCNQRLVVALGTPIDVEKKESPTKEEIDELHTKFTVALRELFNQHKHKMGADWVKRRNRLYFETEKLSTPHVSRKKD
jgi:1-acyl-sn-glycerol-3-phosphate acyltransferase